MNEREIVAEFRQAMSGAGLRTSTRIVPDGEIQRFHVEGDRKGSRNGWAVLHDDPPAGAFGSWKSRRKDTWSAKGARALTPVERDRMVTRIQEDCERHEKELAERRTRGAQRAREEWEGAKPAEPTHPYLAEKGVEPHGLKQAGSVILLPLRDVNGDLHGLQRIYEDGTKKFTTGTWKQGHFHLIGDVPTDRVWVAEGFAPAATVHGATRDPVAVAVDCGNLRPVAEALRGKFPGVEIVIAGDNDHTNKSNGNVGRRHAIEASRAVNGLVAIPELSGDQGSDWNDFAKIHGLETVREKLEQAGPPSPTEWLTAPDLPGSADPDPLPLDALPAVLGDHARSVAASIQVPEGLAGLLCLLCASAAVAGKFEILVDDSWRSEWSPLYGTAILASGERKSSTFAEMVRPLQEWEAERCSELHAVHQGALDVVEVREKELDRAKKDVVRGKATLDEVEAARLALDDAKAKVPLLPRLLVGDATPEALVRRMADNRGRAALLSPEGDPLRMVDGKYSDGAARLDEWKKAWGGETIAPDRIGRDAAHVRRPCLTVGLTIQPSVLGDLRNARTMRGEGLLARFLFVRPRSLVGNRVNSGAAPPLDKAAALRYRDVIRILLEAEPVGYEDDGTSVPHPLHISAEALEVLYDYMDELEREKRDGERLAGIRDWAEKAHGQAVRVAALLELSERAAPGQPLFAEPISVTAMHYAVRIMRALTTHALSVFWGMGADVREKELAHVFNKACGLPDGSTLRDLHVATRGKKSINTAEEVRTLVDDLVERGCLRLHVRPSTGGQPPSPILEINPNIPDTQAQKSQKSPQNVQERTSVTSVRVNPVETYTDRSVAPEIDGLARAECESLDDERAGMQMEDNLTRVSTPDAMEGQTPPPELDLWPEGIQEAGDSEDRSEGFL